MFQSPLFRPISDISKFKEILEQECYNAKIDYNLLQKIQQGGYIDVSMEYINKASAFYSDKLEIAHCRLGQITRWKQDDVHNEQSQILENLEDLYDQYWQYLHKMRSMFLFYYRLLTH